MVELSNFLKTFLKQRTVSLSKALGSIFVYPPKPLGLPWVPVYLCAGLPEALALQPLGFKSLGV
jgi:hypothetical protein